ncbi:MAG: hypothetical protein ACI9UD_002774 [Glaciecola sp.]|jgi:hypothetical protein
MIEQLINLLLFMDCLSFQNAQKPIRRILDINQKFSGILLTRDLAHTLFSIEQRIH